MEPRWLENKQALLARLKRIEGQLRGVQGMVEREEDCERVAQQLAASRKALDKAFYQMMACAMERELAEKSSNQSPEVEDTIEHFTQLMAKYA